MTPRRYKFAARERHAAAGSDGHAAHEVLDTDIWSLEWSVRVANALVNLNIKTLRDLIATNKRELLLMPNFGKTSLREIENALLRHGLRLD